MLKTLFAIFAVFTFGFSATHAQIFTPQDPLYPAPYTCYDGTVFFIYDMGMVGAINTRNNAIFYASTDGSCSGNYSSSITIVSAESDSEAWWTCVTTLGYAYLDGGPYVTQASGTVGHDNMPSDLYFCYF